MVLLAPNSWKFRKQFRGRLTGKASTGNYVAFGDYGLKAITSGYLTNRQIESARKVIVRVTRKFGRIWLRVFPDLPFTKKGLEMPMGSGKGDVDTYRTRIKPGRVLFEISGVDKAAAAAIFKEAGYKLPVKTVMVERGEIK